MASPVVTYSVTPPPNGSAGVQSSNGTITAVGGVLTLTGVTSPVTAASDYVATGIEAGFPYYYSATTNFNIFSDGVNYYVGPAIRRTRQFRVDGFDGQAKSNRVCAALGACR
jgi:hypothetical protein